MSERRRFRAVIADDEPLARGVIRNLLAAEGDITLVAEARTGSDAVDAVRATAPDLLFLDIAMPDLDGFGVLVAIPPAQRPHTIFVTAYDDFAVRAFDEDAVDYLVKPFTDDRFRQTLVRARRRLSDDSVASRGRASRLDQVVVSLGRRTYSVDLADVRWIQADDYCVRLHAIDGDHLLRTSLKTLERQLDPQSFVRVHRQATVNRRWVSALVRERAGGCVVVLMTGERIAISDRRVRTVSDWLGGGIGR